MKDGKTETQRPARLPGLNGGIARYFAGRVRTARLIYNLLLFVWLSFLIMGVVTYVFIDKIMRQQLWESAENALSHTQVTMAADLAEPAVLLTGFAEGVRHRLLLGSDPQSMHDSVRDIAAAIRATSRKLATSSLYGWFEAYGGLFLYDGYGVPAIDYTPQQSPWYAAAIAANGAVAATQPYIGPRLQGFVMSYARRVFDEAARPLAILALDVSLDTIRQYVVETRIAEDGFGLLLDAQLNVIVHPDASLVGKAFQDINPDAPVIADILASGADVREHEMTTHRGEPAVVFFRQLANGWRLGIVTPIDVYYRMAGAMKRFLFTLGFLLAAALSAVLLHIAHARESAIAQTRIMFDGLPIGANLFSRQARNINCNQEAVRLFRAQDKETYLARYLELSPEHQPCGASSLEKGHEWLTKAFDEGYCRFEWVHRTLDGEPLPCEITLVRLVYQEEFVVAGYALDLRELKATMARIADESARFENMAHWYESILAAIPFPVSVQDMQARWTFVNVAFEKLLGKTRKEILGLPCNIWNIDICNTPDCAIECAKRGERQTRFSHTDASYQVDVEVLRNLHGDTTGFIEVVQDISQLEQMAARQMEAESVSRAKSAFLAVVSHEIRTPMNAILGITEIQLQNTALSSDTTEVFSKIYTAGYTLLGIINDILDLSRMEAGKVELVPAKYEVASLLIDTAQLNMVRIGSKPIAFRLQVDEHIPSALFGDDLRIKQILNNLLSNAFKYT
ncbi:MAG: PAS domain-containing protein, partial [Deltaproteobacteria bacterium]|nr:PAS domain-containing protein [Deltaproteobacteria bacterium]